jgi:uncharacterized protein YceK
MKKITLIIIICVLFTACGGRMSKKQSLDHTLYQYAKVMRWADFNTAMTFFSPDMEQTNKPSSTDIERLKQFGVSSYVASPILPGDHENRIIQDVQIKLYNLHTKREKVVIDRQVWEYDGDTKRWLLLSGLPQIVN